MTELTGRVLQNRYRVDVFLGRGGMADVYKVWDQQRAVYLAMKVLHADLAEDRVFLRRFKREANTLAKLQHPHIVRSYGLEMDGRIAFILMDYIEGENLRTRIFYRNRPFTPEDVLEIMQPVCAALHYAHKSGIVHCDIKPANIMIHKNGNVLVSDFGISRITEAATATMVGAGTPAYMSPEQARGEDLTPQSDIYSLGIVLYEMLSGGERPFTGKKSRVTGGTAEKVRWEQMNATPPALRKVNKNLPVALGALVAKMLEKSSNARPQTTLEILSLITKSLEKSEIEVISADIPEQKIQREEPLPDDATEKSDDPPILSQTQKYPYRHRLWMLPILFVATAVFFLFFQNQGTIFLLSPAQSTFETPPISSPVTGSATTEKKPTRFSPSPTATRIVPSTVLDFLEGATVRQFDNLNSDSGWELNTGKISNGRLELIGKNWNGLIRKGKFSEKEGVIVDFRYDTDSEFEMYFDYGEWQSDKYRRFGIYVWSNTHQSNLWLGKNGIGHNNLHGNLQIKPNSWYTLLMVAGADGEFLSIIWDPNAPEKFYRYHERAGEKWSGYKWDFRLGANAGRIELDNFYKIRFTTIK